MRLIDADAFYEKMNDLSKYHEGVYNGAINDCMNLLDNEPTAYDVEAKVAEIKKSPTDDDGLFVSDGNEPMIWKSKAIEIVRNGGKE